MTTAFNVNVFKSDRRFKTGEKLKRTIYCSDADYTTKEEIENFYSYFFRAPEYRIEVSPTTKIVTNIMTGKDIEIDYNTPHCCDPSSETYWSM